MIGTHRSRASTRAAGQGRHAGFTLVELLAVLLILGVLASTALPVAELVSQRRKEAELRESLREIRTAIDRYRQAVDEGRVGRAAGDSGYPPSLEALVDGVPDLRSATGGRLHFLRRIPADPMTRDRESIGGRWALRSHASPPSDPAPGDDVFDVASRSESIGLNGVPYARW